MNALEFTEMVGNLRSSAEMTPAESTPEGAAERMLDTLIALAREATQ